MRIGILTYHNAVNYGAVLQAYALQESLGRMNNVDVVVIDYRSPAVDSQYQFIGYEESGSLKKFVFSNVTVFLRMKKKKIFDKFVSSKLKCTERMCCVSDSALENIDAIIVGSDQVWNPSCSKGDSTYLLSEVASNKLKISYAASMGTGDKIDEFYSIYGVDYRSFIKNFNSISCREKDAADFLSKELSVECETVIDPVLLYDKCDWIDFMSDYDAKKMPDRYIFVYNLGNYSTLHSLVNKIHNQTRYEVVVVNKDAKGDFMYGKYIKKSNIGPQGFLWLLSNADYVVSDSFHATAFSILFEKKFYTVGSDHLNNTNTRMKNILSHYGLEKRYVVCDIDGINLNEELNFSIANKTLQEDRIFAKKWLHKAIDV